MGILKKVVEEPITLNQIEEWQRKQAREGIIAERVRKKIAEAFVPVEKRGKTCRWLCVNANDYNIMMKYLLNVMDTFTDRSKLLTGQMAFLWTATVIVNKNIEAPTGYAEDELPELIKKALEFKDIPTENKENASR